MKRTHKVLLLVALTVILVLGFAGVAFAQWSDVSLSVVGPYGITEAQLGQISQGYMDGTWQPYLNMARQQGTKMAVDAYKIPLMSPATPTYTDVPPSSMYYPYIEGATAAGLTNGVGGGLFDPLGTITREQMAAVISRWVAEKNGYNLATMYTPAEAAAILAPFPDAKQLSPNLTNEMAFAIDFGIIWGTNTGNLAPKGTLTRIQGAAMLIRSWGVLPAPSAPPAKIEQVTADKSENLIGQKHTATFKVTDASGNPVSGALVDFDVQVGQYFVGNISPAAGLTDANGMVSCLLVSTEPGTEVVAATVNTPNGLKTTLATKYWLVLDEVYTYAANTGYEDTTTDGSAVPAQNNAGTTHTWKAQVTVFGPGPRSTSPQDWYNAISTATFDPTNIKPDDGIDASYQYDVYEWNYDFVANTLAPDGFAPRVMAGITVNWSILATYDPDMTPNDGFVDNSGNDSATKDTDKDDVASVGSIVKVDDATVTAEQTAAGMTDASGMSSITITSNATGFTPTQAVATYADNPYPNTLFSHETFKNDKKHYDWEVQPDESAVQLKQWIPHIIGGATGPLAMASNKDNTGEDELVTLTLVDVYGNAIPGYQVEWTLQGVGVLKNAQMVTDSKGKATATLYSSEPGQSIVETKVLDKSGMPAFVYTAMKQWYQIDDVSFTAASMWKLNSKGKPVVGTPVENTVGTTHDFVVKVTGIKWVWTSTDINDNGLNDDQAMVISRDSAYNAAGEVLNEDGSDAYWKDAGVDLPVQTVMRTTASPDDDTTATIYVTRFADATLLPGEFWGDAPGGDNDGDEAQVVWSALAGKGIDFFNNIGDADEVGTPPESNTPLPVEIGGGTDGMPEFVGNIKSFVTKWTDVIYGSTKYHYDAVTDVNGDATVTVTSTNKGDQYVYAVADYPGNPQSSGASNAGTPLLWSQLRFATAEKVWLADTSGVKATDRVFGVSYPFFDTLGAKAVLAKQPDQFEGVIVEGNSYTDPIDEEWSGYDLTGAATVTIAAPPAGTAPTGITATLAGGTVTFGGTALPAGSGYTAADLNAAVTAVLPAGGATATATAGTNGSTNNAIVQVHVTAGGSGYTVAPTVNMPAPDIAGGTQATATANISGGSVVSITIVNHGSGYTNLTPEAYTVTFTSNNTAAVTVGHITGVAGNQVSALTGLTGLSYPDGGPYAVTVPAPIKEQATADVTTSGGVVTGFTNVDGGLGYITAPAVNIYGAGTGAAAHATVNSDSSVSLTLDSGGTGYTGGDTGDSTGENPNRETLAVQVFDQYGNSLPDYKVVWQIVQQGTTTNGTVDTYHPYAHFEFVEHDSTSGDPAVISDTNKHVKINPIWNNGGSDDDLAWGYTLNGQIDFTLSLDSAANVDLVMDDTADTLRAMGEGTEFSDIVNVTVYAPDGSVFDQFTQIKNWVFPPVPVSQVRMWLATSDEFADITGPWVTSLTTNDAYYGIKIQTGDASWNPAPADVLVKVGGPFPYAGTLLDFGVNGIDEFGGQLSPTVSGTYTFTPYIDMDFDGIIDAGDIPGAPVTLIVP